MHRQADYPLCTGHSGQQQDRRPKNMTTTTTATMTTTTVITTIRHARGACDSSQAISVLLLGVVAWSCAIEPASQPVNVGHAFRSLPSQTLQTDTLTTKASSHSQIKLLTTNINFQIQNCASRAKFPSPPFLLPLCPIANRLLSSCLFGWARLL